MIGEVQDCLGQLVVCLVTVLKTLLQSVHTAQFQRRSRKVRGFLKCLKMVDGSLFLVANSQNIILCSYTKTITLNKIQDVRGI